MQTTKQTSHLIEPFPSNSNPLVSAQAILLSSAENPNTNSKNVQCLSRPNNFQWRTWRTSPSHRTIPLMMTITIRTYISDRLSLGLPLRISRTAKRSSRKWKRSKLLISRKMRKIKMRVIWQFRRIIGFGLLNKKKKLNRRRRTDKRIRFTVRPISKVFKRSMAMSMVSARWQPTVQKLNKNWLWQRRPLQ